MAENLVINGVTYNGVESVALNTTDGKKVLYFEGQPVDIVQESGDRTDAVMSQAAVKNYALSKNGDASCVIVDFASSPPEPENIEDGSTLAVIFATIRHWFSCFAKVTFSGSYKDLNDRPTIPSKTSDLTNDSGFLTGYTETDPTVPSWAKASSKPSYTKSEVGLGNVENVKQYSASNPPPYPVTKVNGKTGAVSLSAADVGAVPTTNALTVTGVDADGVTHTWTMYGTKTS